MTHLNGNGGFFNIKIAIYKLKTSAFNYSLKFYLQHNDILIKIKYLKYQVAS